jgi:hypothetical protein
LGDVMIPTSLAKTFIGPVDEAAGAVAVVICSCEGVVGRQAARVPVGRTIVPLVFTTVPGRKFPG